MKIKEIYSEAAKLGLCVGGTQGFVYFGRVIVCDNILDALLEVCRIERHKEWGSDKVLKLENLADIAQELLELELQ
jgi:hypothetical protein